MRGGVARLLRQLLAPTLWVAGLVLILLGEAILGLALLVAGSFVRVAMRANRRRDQLEQAIVGVTVGEVMETQPLVIAPQATLDTFGDLLDPDGATTVAQVMREGRLEGLVGIREVGRVPRERWATVHASEVMVGSEALRELAPEDALRPVADQLGASAAPGFPVLDEGRPVGILTRLAVGRVLDQRANASRGMSADQAAPGSVSTNRTPAAEPPGGPSGIDPADGD